MLNQDPTLSKTSIMGTSTAPLSTAPSVLINDNNNMNDDNNNINGENTGNNNNNNKLLYTILPSPIQGNADWRKYKCLKLNNGITVCLVNDKESKTTSAAVTVTAGAADDPRSMSGLAHFCEHMVFLGSKKYPGENEYKRYLAQHGGRSNASTSLHSTTYKFEILSTHAEHIFDIFSNFFIEPLFTLSGTSREINAVDSENSKNLIADVRRRLQILKSIGDNKHYFTKFTTGNAKTLSTINDKEIEILRNALLTFHSKHYRPEHMTVVIAGPQSLDILQDWVVTHFSLMKNDNTFPNDIQQMNDMQKLIHEASLETPPYYFNAPIQPFKSPFRPELQNYLLDKLKENIKDISNNSKETAWPIQVTIKPIRSMRKLVLLFPLPPVHNNPDQNPISIISHLLGHEGPNSSFAILQNLGLISSLSSGTRFSGPDFSIFQLDIGLTEIGEIQWKTVVDIVLQHCKLIANTAENALNEQKSSTSDDKTSTTDVKQYLQQLWGETVKLHTIFFHQNSPGSVYTLAPDLSCSIVQNGIEKSLCAGSNLYENENTFPLNDVVDFTKRLIISNMMIERCSENAWNEIEEKYNANKKEEATRESIVYVKDEDIIIENKVEQWYDIDYYLSTISDNDVKCWTAEENSFYNAKDLLQLPQLNRYIPRTLELCKDLPDEAKHGSRIDKEINPPNLLINDKNIGRLWHRLDDRYALPKSALLFLLQNPATEHIPSSAPTNDKDITTWKFDTSLKVHSSLLSSIFSQALAQETYDASLAGLHWDLSLGVTGIRLNCTGFSDRLSDLSLKIIQEFLDGDFIKESYFISAKDRLIRSLQTFFESSRADSNAQYYRDFILSSRNNGIHETLEAVMNTTFESIKAHHINLLKQNDTSIDCLFSGNVAEKEATDFFEKASKLITDNNPTTFQTQKNLDTFRPESIERRLSPGNEVELHFASKNLQEENGACLVTFQSTIPGFRGENLSTPESLHNSACIRLLCHMLREPLFDELRTKQTLGYIVSSYHDMSFSCVPSPDLGLKQSIPIDMIVVYVLSKKVSPPEIAQRIDDFLVQFREFLINIPDSEIKHHSSALSIKMVKPIQKLGTESSTQFTKIRRYASEVLGSNDMNKDQNNDVEIPWDSAKVLANTIESLTRQDIIDTWDQITNPTTRARIVSCVYGSTFPLQVDQLTNKTTLPGKTVVINSMEEILQYRKQLSIYDKTFVPVSSRSTNSNFIKQSIQGFLPPFMLRTKAQYPTSSLLGVAAVIGVGAIAGWTFFGRNKKNTR